MTKITTLNSTEETGKFQYEVGSFLLPRLDPFVERTLDRQLLALEDSFHASCKTIRWLTAAQPNCSTSVPTILETASDYMKASSAVLLRIAFECRDEKQKQAENFQETEFMQTRSSYAELVQLFPNGLETLRSLINELGSVEAAPTQRASDTGTDQLPNPIKGGDDLTQAANDGNQESCKDRIETLIDRMELVHDEHWSNSYEYRDSVL